MFSVSFALALAAAAPPVVHDFIGPKRARLEAQEAELRRQLGDARWMSDMGRATLIRLGIERGWRDCAANEGSALARSSERPAELLAEEAAARTCSVWRDMLGQALSGGAYPYTSGHISREDMVAAAGLDASRAALERVLLWRSGSGPAPAAASSPEAAPMPTVPTPPPEPEPTADPAPQDEETIVVVARRDGRCRVMLADRTLSDRQLEANARVWAANGTPLKVVRPAGAGYDCMARIVWQLGRHGVRLFRFVDSRSEP